jgi:lipopolysaccharide export system permease protein
MTQIDRYILVLYLRVFIVCFLTLSGLLIVVQLFTNIDEFAAYGKANGGFVRGLIIYFGPQMLSIFDRMCGLITLLAIMFVIAWLQRTHELTAILAAGISKKRIVVPLLYASVLLIIVSAILRETAIPQFSDILSKRPRDLIGERNESLRPTEDVDQGFIVVGRQLLKNTRSIANPVFKFTGPIAAQTRQIEGELAQFLEANNEHSAGFLVTNYRPSEPLTLTGSLVHEERYFLMLPADQKWLQPNQCFISSELDFDLLSGGRGRQYASTAELISDLRNRSYYHGPELKVTMHSRFVQPFLDFTQILIGLPFILTGLDRNLVRMVASCIIIFALFYAITFGLRTLGAHETLLTASAGAWAPVLLFAPVAWAKSVAAMYS